MLRILAEALTYDDVSLVPAHSIVLPKDVNTSTRLTKSLTLNIPIVSAAMDTVTDARLAIAMAQLGGIGILHKNMSWEEQAKAVERVNAELSVIERIRRFLIADEPFAIENQQLTPSLKIRRHVLREVYGERLDALYRG